MTLPTYKLAPVRWELGQILLPEHFTALQSSLAAEIRLRAAIAGLPAYGVAEVSWNADALKQGQLAVRSLTAVMPSGLAVNVPGSGTLGEVSLKAAGAPQVPVYLHVLGERVGAIGNPAYVDDPKTLHRELLSLRLSTQPALERSVESMLLAIFERQLERWVLRRAYIPPLLQVGTHPFLGEPCEELARRLVAFTAQLKEELENRFLRTDRKSNARGCMIDVCQVASVLDEIKQGVHHHPYLLFEALRRLYLQLCAFKDRVPDRLSLPYLHDGLGECFGALFSYLNRNLDPEEAKLSYTELRRQDGRFLLEKFPEPLHKASKVYLLVSQTARQTRVSLEGVKLASPTRLELVHRAALRGIPFEPVLDPPSAHHFVQGLDFYELTLGEEWKHARNELGLSFYVTPQLESPEINVLLFWQL